MRLFLDTNVFVAVLCAEAQAPAARPLLSAPFDGDEVKSCDFVGAEFCSVIARLVRQRTMSQDEARVAIGRFDAWAEQTGRLVPIDGSDIQVATGYIRRLDLNLRAPDAINIAVAARIGATLVTFDKRMIECAGVLGVAAIEP